MLGPSTNSIQYAYDFYKHELLGDIRCPNIKAKLNLQHACKPVFSQFKSNQIVALIIFGSAVRFPRMTTKFKRSWWKRKLIPRQVPESLKPKDFDLAVVLNQEVDKIPHIHMEQDVKITDHGYRYFKNIRHEAIHILFTCLDELKRRMNDTDNHIAQSLLTEGVLLFGKELPGMRHCRIVEWTEPHLRNLRVRGRIIDGPLSICPKCGSESLGFIRFCPVCGSDIPWNNRTTR